MIQTTQAALPRQRLGTLGPELGIQGLGCMGMSEFYGPTDASAAHATLERAVELGVGLFDTADMYGLGQNEILLSPFVRKHRERVVIATKFGYTRSPERPDDWSIDTSPAHIRQAVDASLQRLGVEVIDLYYMHRHNPAIAIEESVGAMADLVQAGKVRWLGLCEVPASTLRAAHAVHPITALQSEWSLLSRGIEGDVLDAARELNIAVVPFAPMGRGLLTGTVHADALSVNDARRHFPRFHAQNLASNQSLVAQVQRLAQARGISTAQLALAWLYQQATRLQVQVFPIPGTRNRQRLESNVQAASIALSEAEMQALDGLAAQVQGVAI